MATEQCSPVLSPVENIVGGTLSTLQNYANQAYQMVIEAANSLDDHVIAAIPLNVSFNPAGGPGTFLPPPTPDSNITPFALPEEGPPPEPNITDVTIDTNLAGSAPPEPRDLDYRYAVPGGQPGALTITDPGEAPTFDTVLFPAPPADIEGRLPLVPTSTTSPSPTPRCC